MCGPISENHGLDGPDWSIGGRFLLKWEVGIVYPIEGLDGAAAARPSLQ